MLLVNIQNSLHCKQRMLLVNIQNSLHCKQHMLLVSIQNSLHCKQGSLETRQCNFGGKIYIEAKGEVQRSDSVSTQYLFVKV